VSRLSRRLRSHPRADWLALAEAWWLLLASDLCLRLFPFPRVDHLFSPRTASALSGSSVGQQDVATRCAWATTAAARRHLWPMRCLTRSLCLRWLLGRRGLPAQLRLGVAREADGLLAHAWVELQGQPVGEETQAVDRFAPLS